MEADIFVPVAYALNLHRKEGGLTDVLEMRPFGLKVTEEALDGAWSVGTPGWPKWWAMEHRAMNSRVDRGSRSGAQPTGRTARSDCRPKLHTVQSEPRV